MEGFYLLCGHLLGDYILQNDYLAANKANPHPGGQRPCTKHLCDYGEYTTAGTPDERDAWDAAWRKWNVGHLACTAHCALYTLAVWATSWWWMPGWGIAACFLTHWVMDRFGLARKIMTNWSGQKVFADRMGPWSIIVTDNTFHLLTLAGIAALCGRGF